jgi:hypothetical protein
MEMDEIVELDFADTSALSDPEAFDSVAGKQKGKDHGLRSMHGRADARDVHPASVPEGKGKKKAKKADSGSAASGSITFGGSPNKAQPIDAPSKIHTHPDAIHPPTARDALLQSVITHVNGDFRGLTRNDFVREILTLIHVSTTHFVFVSGIEVYVADRYQLRRQNVQGLPAASRLAKQFTKPCSSGLLNLTAHTTTAMVMVWTSHIKPPLIQPLKPS